MGISPRSVYCIRLQAAVSSVSDFGIQKWSLFGDDEDKTESESSSSGGILDWVEEKASGAVSSVTQAGNDAYDWAKKEDVAAVDWAKEKGSAAVPLEEARDWVIERGQEAWNWITEQGNTILGKKWGCEAVPCNVQQIEDGANCPDRVYGSSDYIYSNFDDACEAAKRDANSKVPRGCYKRHCNCNNKCKQK